MSYFKTAEEIYKEMTSSLGDVDTSENSFIYNNLMPVAMEIATSLLDLDEAEKKSFISLALENGYSDYIDLRADEYGLIRKTATYARVLVKFTGASGTILPLGSIVGTLDNRLYVTESDMTIGEDGTGTCYVVSSETGSKYNVNIGEINYFPIKYSGITSVTNESEYTEAYDKESDEEFVKRYYLKVREIATSGNVSHYKQWCLSIKGVGSVNVYECKNDKYEKENGSVLCVITDSNHRGADEELIDQVKSYIETVRPVGAKVYVISSSELTINVSAKLVINTKEYTKEEIEKSIKSSIEEYFIYLDDNRDINYISIAKISAIMMSYVGVIDIRELLLNEDRNNIDIPNNTVPILGTLNITIV